MRTELRAESTLVPLSDGEDIELTPGQPWPSAYRGSRYSLTDSRRRNWNTVMEWQYHDLSVHLQPPEGLPDMMKKVGKSGGTGRGSFRITADGEVLTKVHADDYSNVEEAPVSKGWIPVYLGRLNGSLEFTDITIDPNPLDGTEIAVWEGLPFNHGECWTIGGNGNLIWKWRDYRFESAFDHDELVSRYQKFRQPSGRLYINEYGHVFVNIDPDDVPRSTEDTVLTVYEQWRETAERKDKTAALRLVNRRLRATSPTNDPDDGLLPMYVGHLQAFDGGVVPKPVVDDPRYYRACGREEIDATW